MPHAHQRSNHHRPTTVSKSSVSHLTAAVKNDKSIQKGDSSAHFHSHALVELLKKTKWMPESKPGRAVVRVHMVHNAYDWTRRDC